MSDPLLLSPSLLLDFANSTLGFGISAKNRNWVGGSFFGDGHDTVSRTPRTISPYLAHTHRTLQKQTLPRRGLGFRGVCELLPRAAVIFVFDVYKMLRFRF